MTSFDLRPQYTEFQVVFQIAQHVMRARVVCVFEYGGCRRDDSGGVELWWSAAIPLHLLNKCSVFGVDESHSGHLGSRCRKSLWERGHMSVQRCEGGGLGCEDGFEPLVECVRYSRL